MNLVTGMARLAGRILSSVHIKFPPGYQDEILYVIACTNPLMASTHDFLRSNSEN